MAAVQQGMKSAGFPGTKPNPYRERSTVNLHYQLSKYMGTGEPQELSKEHDLTTVRDTCGPTQTPTDIDIDALREKYAAERDKRLRPEGASQYLELEGRFRRLLRGRSLHAGDARATRSSRTSTSPSSAAASPDCWPGRT